MLVEVPIDGVIFPGSPRYSLWFPHNGSCGNIIIKKYNKIPQERWASIGSSNDALNILLLSLYDQWIPSVLPSWKNVNKSHCCSNSSLQIWLGNALQFPKNCNLSVRVWGTEEIAQMVKVACHSSMRNQCCIRIVHIASQVCWCLQS